MFQGCYTALITPFRNGEVDWPAFDNLVEWQVDQGIHGLVACGTTGESPTLSKNEHIKIVERCARIVRGRVPVVAGTGSYSTADTIALTRQAIEAGADAALIVTPYYNKPPQEGLYQHYKTIHDSVGCPIILYNIPGRCIIDISPETMGHLSRLPRIVGVKDATGDLSRPVKTRAACGPDFIQLSGNDDSSAAFLAMGGHGCISVASNLAPALCARMQTAWQEGNIKEFSLIRDRLAPLFDVLFTEPSPAPVKYAASRMGIATAEVRLPLVETSESCRLKIDAVLDALDLPLPAIAEANRAMA